MVAASAQELRDRELKPAIDFATIEMPVQIVSIKLNGSDVAKVQNPTNRWTRAVGACFVTNPCSRVP